MTEIPEHLLKRSRDRRNALGLGGGDAEGSTEQPAAPAAGAATPAATTPAAPAAPSGPAPRKAAAAPAAPPPPKPDSPVVAAAKRRHKIPYWAMFALSIMPIWVFMYVRAMTAPPEVVEGPMGVGAEVYAGSCSSCHGAGGEGASGRQLDNGEVDKTFPHIEDQIRFVYFGTDRYLTAGIDIYGDPNREGGAHATGSIGAMPGWGTNAGGALTDAQIIEVVCHERFGLAGGPDITAEGPLTTEYENWCSEEAPVFAAVEAGTALADLDTAAIVDLEGNPISIIDIGDAPAPATAG